MIFDKVAGRGGLSMNAIVLALRFSYDELLSRNLVFIDSGQSLDDHQRGSIRSGFG